ncbi:hypothetical protein F5Y14DRAFT_408523 [Nemania sp. NC0429]|nr:hypothetical protein F5Y14DRAFT_408523 [Nemania sp. NC0429]
MPPIRCANAPSAARLFVQLSARSSSNPVLDVLLPPRGAQPRAFYAHVAGDGGAPGQPMPSRVAANATAARRQPVAVKRTFGTSRLLAKTLAVHNPQTDEDGNAMMLEITPRAANRLSQIMSKDKNDHLALRIQVESGGCHGFQYLMSLTTLPSTGASASSLAPEQVAEDVTPSTTTANTPSPPALGEDDVIFAFAPDDAKAPAATTSPKIVLDLPSLELLKGSKVDYTMELIGSQFKIVDNPLATSSCGCGTSFDIKL